MNKNHCLILGGSRAGRATGQYAIAAFLRRNNWDCNVVDHFLHWPKSDLFKYLKKHITANTKWVGVSYTWVDDSSEKVKKLSEFIKSINPNILFIAGGQAPYQHDLGADYYVFGYAELAIIKILDYEFNNGPPVFYTRFFKGKLVDAIHNYASYNLPTYSITYNEDDFVSKKDTLVVETSRGCKFKCDFCSFPFIGIKEDTSASEENLYRELMTNYEKWGVKTYVLADETINDRVEKLIKIKNVVKRLDFKPDFSAFARIDLFRNHPELIELMAEGRIWGHYYGTETLNRESGKTIGKGQNPEYVKESLLNVRDYFLKNVGLYRGTVGMIAGLPYETIDSIRASQQWFIKNWSDQNVIWWSLQIVNNGVLSAFGKDLTKYGYEPLSDDIVRTKLNKTGPLLNSEIFWKNQHTDIFEVRDLVSKEFNFEFRLGNFELFYLLPYTTYEKGLTLAKSDGLQHIVNKSRIQEYINKKKSS